MPDGAVHRRCQFFLTFTVRIRKSSMPDGFFSFMLPFQFHLCPFLICRNKFCKPFIQFCLLIEVMKSSDFLSIQICIRHLHTNFFQISLICINIRITFCLCQMNGIGFFHSFQISEYSLDLVDDRSALICKYSIGSSFYNQKKISAISFRLQKYFRMIIRSHLSLNLTMQPAAHLHGIFICHRTSSIVYITAS